MTSLRGRTLFLLDCLVEGLLELLDFFLAGVVAGLVPEGLSVDGLVSVAAGSVVEGRS